MTERAVRFHGAGGPDVISIGDLPIEHRRDPGVGEVAVRVVASALNRADVLQRKGLYPAPASVVADVPGLEFAGTIEAVGESDTGHWAIGDRVMGIVGGGGMSTRLLTRADALLPIPSTVNLDEAAAIPEVFLTAFDALIVNAKLAIGENVLIHAVASGVGTAAIQIAQRCGAQTFGTSRTADKLDGLDALGLDHPILCDENGFAQAIAQATEGKGVAVILDTVGGSYFQQNIQSLARGGRMVIIGLVGGRVAHAPLALILGKRLEIRGSVLRSRSPAEKAQLTDRFTTQMIPLFEQKRLRPVVDRTLPMDDIKKAHQLLEDNQTTGKIIMRW